MAIGRADAGNARAVCDGQRGSVWQDLCFDFTGATVNTIGLTIIFDNGVLGAALEGVWTVLRRTDEPRMTRFLAAQLATSHYFDITAAERDFGYSPAVSIEEGMRRLGKWLRRESNV